jgi:hypothetical protein
MCAINMTMRLLLERLFTLYASIEGSRRRGVTTGLHAARKG